jgi:hypothetical protein
MTQEGLAVLWGFTALGVLPIFMKLDTSIYKRNGMSRRFYFSITWVFILVSLNMVWPIGIPILAYFLWTTIQKQKPIQLPTARIHRLT